MTTAFTGEDKPLWERFRKPVRGARVLAKADADDKAATVEKREKGAAKNRDGRCRWPEKHVCRCGREAAHIKDASLGGEMNRENLVVLCGWLHRRGPETIHGKQLRIDKETARGAEGALSFWKQGPDGEYFLVARETSPFVLERD